MTKQQRQTVKDLRTWANFLRKQVPEGNFYMNTWKYGDAPLDPEQMDGSCGTTACAAGWATAIPEFKERGLRISFGHRLGYDPRFDSHQSPQIRITYLDYRGSRAIAAFFRIDDSEAFHITLPNEYSKPETPTIEEVAKRIEELADAYECGKRRRQL